MTTGLAATIEWNAGNGAWEISGNWNPATVPGLADSAMIRNGGTANLANGLSYSVSELRLGSSSNTGTLNITSGSLTSTTLNAFDDGGTLSLDGAGASLIQQNGFFSFGSGNLRLNNNATITTTSGTVFYIGTSANTASAVVENNAVLDVNAESVALGATGSSTGTLTVQSGGRARLVGTDTHFVIMGGISGTTANLNINGTGGSRGAVEINSIRESAGTGTINFDGGILRALSDQSNLIQSFEAGDVTINAGGAFIDSNGFNIGISSILSGNGRLTKQGTGTLTLSGANTYTGNTIVDAGTLAINGGAINSPAAFLNVGFGSGTDATLNLTSGSITSFGAYIGAMAGATGRVNVSGGTWTKSAGLFVGDFGNGTLDISGGSVSGESAYIGNQAGSSGLVQVSGGALANTNFMTVGNFGDGRLEISGTGTVSTPQLFIGESPGGTSLVDVSGGTLTNTTLTVVGDGGDGTLQISGTGSVSSSGSILGRFAGSTGLALVSGGSWSNSDFLHIGGTGGGVGILTISGTGQVSSTTAQLATQGSATGTLNLNGGMLRTGQVSEGTGTGGGAVNFNGGSLQLTGNQADLFSGFEAGDVMLNSGGGTIDTQGFSIATSQVLQGTGGLTKRGSGTLTLSGTNTYAGTTTITEGTLRLSGGSAISNTAGIVVGSGTLELGSSETIGSLSGSGSVDLGSSTLTTGTGVSTTFSGIVHNTGSLTKQGTGTLTLTGNNTYSGGTTVSAGTLQVGDGGTTGSITGNVTNNSNLTFNRSDDLTLGGTISGTGELNKIGAGTLTLSGASTYDGDTTVSAGELQLLGSLGNTALAVQNGARLSGTGTTLGSVAVENGGRLAPGTSPGTLTTGSMTLNATSQLDYELDTPNIVGGGVNDLVVVNGDLTLDGILNITDLGNFGDGTYRLFDYSGNLTNNGLLFGIVPTPFDFTVDDSVSNQINLTVTAATAQFWDGASTTANGTIDGGTGTWNGATTNWTNSGGNSNSAWAGGLAAVFAGSAGTVTLADGFTADANGYDFQVAGYTLAAAGNGAITITGSTPFATTDGTTTISAPVTGSGLLDKKGPGTLTLTGNNSYSGGTTISEGTLQIGNGGSTGMVAGNISNNGTLIFDRAGDYFYNGVVSGTGDFIQNRSILRLSAAQTYTGSTTIRNNSILVLPFINQSLSGSTIVDVEAGSSFDFSNSLLTISGLTGSGTVYSFGGSSGNLTLNIASGTSTFGGSFGGPFANFGITKAGAGTQILTGISTHTGGTSITGGTLRVSSDANLGNASGGLLIDGGRLRTTESFATGRDTVLGAGGGEFSQANNTTLTHNGVISGSGVLEKLGRGNLVLTGNNTYTGGTHIHRGTLRISADENLGDASGNLEIYGARLRTTESFSTSRDTLLEGGFGELSQRNGTILTHNGVISGSGALAKLGNGTLVLAGENNHTGGTFIDRGTLRIGGGGTTGSITGNISNDAALAFNRSDDISFGGVISGTGTLTKLGAGALELTGNSTYTGDTAVEAGSLLVNGGLGGTAVTVSDNALLGGGGILGGNVTILSGGILSPGHSTGIITIDGNLDLHSGSFTRMEINGTTPGTGYDQIVVGGTATLGGTLELFFGGGMSNGDTFTLIDTPNPIAGDFDSVVNVLGNALTFSTSISEDYLLTITAVQTDYEPFALTPNQRAVATTIDDLALTGDLNPLIDFLNTLPGDSLPPAFDQIAPASFAFIAESVFANSRFRHRSLSGHMGQRRRESSSPGIARMPVSWSGKQAPAHDDRRWGFFAAGNFGHLDNDRPGNGYDSSVGGPMLGVDYLINDTTIIGFHTGYDRSDLDFGGNVGGVRGDAATFGLYATWFHENGTWAEGSLGGGYHSFDTERNVLGATAKGDTHADELLASLKLGHDLRFGSRREWLFTPTVGLAYNRLKTDGFTENGSLAPLTILDQTAESLRGEIGFQLSYQHDWAGILWQPYVHCGWQHEFLDPSESLDARFAVGGNIFTVNGPSSPRNTLTYGTGVNAVLSEKLSAGLGYNGETNGSVQNHQFNASLRFRF